MRPGSWIHDDAMVSRNVFRVCQDMDMAILSRIYDDVIKIRFHLHVLSKMLR